MFRDQDHPLYKLQKELAAQGPVNEELMHMVEKQYPKDMVVKISTTGYTGVIVGPNRSTGFYHGNILPVYVKITKSDNPKHQDAVGEVFPYSLDDIIPAPVAEVAHA